MPPTRSPRGLLPLTVLSVVVVLVVVGQARGAWLSNLHNGLLAVAFTGVGTYVLFQRPGHRLGVLFMVTGTVEAVLFLGRQVGHSPGGDSDRWWAWLGVWPVSLALALTTVSVLTFPDGRLPSPRWRWLVVSVLGVASVTAALSAVWPVEYADAGVRLAHPLHAEVPPEVDDLWTSLAHPSYVAMQALWVVAVVARWSGARAQVRRQLAWLVGAAALSLGALLVGLAVAGSPRAGVLSAALLPVAAGWAIVHGQHRAAHDALTWASRAGPAPEDLPGALAEAVATALAAPGAILWMGRADALHPIGVWPAGEVHAPETVERIEASRSWHTRRVDRHGELLGALSVVRSDDGEPTLAQSRLLDDLTAQAALVIDRVGLASIVDEQRRAGHLDALTPRERDVLELMARGYSNSAICDELHLSVKTVEPVVGSVFTKLGLHLDPASNRRVLAVLAYMQRHP